MKIRKTHNIVGSQVFFPLKNTKNVKNTKFKEQKHSSKNRKIALFVLLKTIIKNNFQKQEPNKQALSFFHQKDK